MSDEDDGVSKSKVKSATVVAGSEKSKDDQLSPVLSVEDNGVNEGSAAKEPFKKIDLRDLKVATVMILEALPDLKEYEVELAMNTMIRGFHGGQGTAWVPLNKKLYDLLKVLISEVSVAGVNTFHLLLKGVEVATDEYSKASRKTQIENSLQSALRERKACEDAERLHLALEDEKKKSLVCVAAREKSNSLLESSKRANKQLVTEAGAREKQIVSLTDTMSGLRQQVVSQTDVITQYKSCEVMHEDGSSGQAVASRAEVANVASVLHDFQERIEKASRDAIEHQEVSTKKMGEEIKAVMAQENAVVCDRMDHLTERLNEMELATSQIAGQMGHELGERVPVLIERIVYPQASQEVGADERNRREGHQRLCHLWRKCEEILRLTMVHKGITLWKNFMVCSVRADKRAFAHTGRVISRYEYKGGVSKEALNEKLVVWDDHLDENTCVDYNCLATRLLNTSVDGSRLLWRDSPEVEGEANEVGSEPSKVLSAGMGSAFALTCSG